MLAMGLKAEEKEDFQVSMARKIKVWGIGIETTPLTINESMRQE